MDRDGGSCLEKSLCDGTVTQRQIGWIAYCHLETMIYSYLS